MEQRALAGLLRSVDAADAFERFADGLPFLQAELCAIGETGFGFCRIAETDAHLTYMPLPFRTNR